jgi:hypothetical protein
MDLGSEIREFGKNLSRIQGSKRHRIPDPDPQHCDAGSTLCTGAHINGFSLSRGSTAALLPLRNMTFVISGKLDKTKVGHVLFFRSFAVPDPHRNTEHCEYVDNMFGWLEWLENFSCSQEMPITVDSFPDH